MNEDLFLHIYMYFNGLPLIYTSLIGQNGILTFPKYKHLYLEIKKNSSSQLTVYYRH